MDDSEEALAHDLAAVARISAVPTILNVICQTTGMGFAAVARVTDRTWTACAVRDDIPLGLAPGGDLALDTTLCTEVRAARQPVVIEHVAEDEVYRDHHTPKMYGFQSYISVPIVLQNGEYFGNLCALDPRPMKLRTPQVRDMFALFAELIGKQLESERRHLAVGVELASERNTAELREQFIAVVGHDLRNPLAAVRTIGELLRRGAPGMDLPKLGERLQSSTRRMSLLIDDVLDFARGRLGSGMAVRLAREPELDVLLANVVNELQVAHPDRDIGVHIAVTHAVRCDAARLQQLLSNLVNNALTHGAAQSPVEVMVSDDGQTLQLRVCNQGEPIPAEQLGRLFEPYWRSSNRHEEGLGLGLYICAQIVKAHGGQLDVTSTAEDGTCFTARIPL